MGALGRMGTLTGRAGYAIMRNERLLRTDYEMLVEMRDKMIRKYAPEGADRIMQTDPGFKGFEKEYTDFLQNTVDFEPYTISPEEYDVENVYCEKATAEDYRIVEALIVKAP
jgi:hypothetical protein